MILTLKINRPSIRNKIEKAAENKGRPVARKMAYDRFFRAKQRMLLKFEAHPVTREIEAGGGIGTGKVLAYGNLFSFLGFNSGDKPIEGVREKLESYTYWLGNPTYVNKKWVFKVNAPAIEFLKRDTALPWEGGGPSWITAVEKGIPNIVHYLNFRRGNKGRSGYGLQAAGIVDTGRPDFDGVKDYLTKILENFRNTINNGGLVE